MDMGYWQKIATMAGTLFLVAGLTSCATTQDRPTTMEHIHQSTEADVIPEIVANPELDEVPDDITDELLTDLNNDWDASDLAAVPTVERFDVNVQNIQMATFLMALVENSDINMVVHPDIEGKISLSLNNVTVPEVMETLRSVYDLEYKVVSNAYHVLPAKMETQIFSIDYINLKRSGRSDTRVSSGQQAINGGGSDSNSTTDSTTDGDDGGSDTIGSKITTESSSDVWVELEATIKSLIGEEDGRTVVASPQSGILVVRAMPSELRMIDDFLTHTHDVLHRQVVLETKILEIELSDGYQAGINWSAVDVFTNGNSYRTGQIGGGTIVNTGTSEIQFNEGSLDPSVGGIIDGLTTSAFGGMFTLAFGVDKFNGFIEALETQGNVQVLSSPRVVTLNNQKAVIKVGTDEFFVTGVTTTSVTGTATTVSPEIELTPFFSGIALDVIPQIDENGYVTLHIHPSVSEVVDQQKNITFGGQTQSLPLAFNSVREADSIVRAASGEVVVIGGLMKEITKENNAAVPFLSKVPFLGSFFEHNKQLSTKSELVILLRPIVVNDDIRRQQVNSVESRFKELDRKFNFGSKPNVFPPK